MQHPVTIAVVLYQGEDVPAHSLGIFTPEWVDRLYRGVSRNTSRPFNFVCFVDRDYKFSEPVQSIKLKLPYRNMFSLLEPFSEDLGRVVFMGLDTIITGNIDSLMDYRGEFAMLKDPWFDRPCSGVMMFPHSPAIWENFVSQHEQAAKDATMFGFPSDMVYLEKVPHVLMDDTGIYSYKAHIRPNPRLLENAKIVYFHGKDKPHELAGLPWVEKHWGEPILAKARDKYINGLNNDRKVMLAQVGINIKRDLPWFDGGEVHHGAALLVGGGPSLADVLPKLQTRRSHGGKIYALNGTHDWLIERGIIPDYHVMLDSRIENVEFVRKPHKKVKYLISGFCHPEVFEALRGFDVTLWLSDMDGVQALVQDIADKPVCLIGGGATVGMKTMYLCYLKGYRRMHFYGFDSSYRDGENHAYKQSLNDKESRMEIFCAGRSFICAPWMAKQAQEFQNQSRKLTQLGCELFVHGDGLIPFMAQQMARAA